MNTVCILQKDHINPSTFIFWIQQYNYTIIPWLSILLQNLIVFTLWVSYQKQELVTLFDYIGSLPVFGGVRVAHIRPVSCIPNASSVFGLSLLFSLTFICCVCLRPVSCLPNVASVFGLSILFCVSSSCVLCTQCCQCLWTVHSWFALRPFLTLICHFWYFLSTGSELDLKLVSQSSKCEIQ